MWRVGRQGVTQPSIFNITEIALSAESLISSLTHFLSFGSREAGARGFEMAVQCRESLFSAYESFLKRERNREIPPLPPLCMRCFGLDLMMS